MPRKIFVIGHKNPNTDSIVSALAYTERFRLQGDQYVVAARQGQVWRETRVSTNSITIGGIMSRKSR